MRRRFLWWCVWILLLTQTGWSVSARGEESEAALGRVAAREMEHRYGTFNDAAANARLKRLAEPLARASGCHTAMQFRILASDEPNGIALLGGYIFVTRGLLKLLPEDDLLSAALAHEVAHIALGHMTEMLHERQARRQEKETVTSDGETPAQTREKAADRAAICYLYAVGIEPRTMIRLLQRLSQQPCLNATGSRTHPTWQARILNLEEYLRTMQYRPAAQSATCQDSK